MFKLLRSSKRFSLLPFLVAFPLVDIYHKGIIKQPDLGQFCSLTLTLTWMFSVRGRSVHMFVGEAPCFLSHGKFTCSGPILGIFCLLLCSFPPFLQWIFFFCFHLPCSGNNKADFYLYAQMLGRSNLVGLLYISLSVPSFSAFLSVLHVWACVIEPI